MAAREQQARDAVGLVGGLDEHFFHAADEIAERVEGFGAEDFRGMQHENSLTNAFCGNCWADTPAAYASVAGKKKARDRERLGRGRAEIA